ncbi:MAG TPA: DNA polymerase III subunit gamma/tau [Solirubrobacteraceae bacterium]|nr:DNA polymerase III subunit gamma/tau [Solirubrobacteraceae bacterium]
MAQQERQQDEQRSLYRRHRPRTFAEVVGQEPVVRTLRNAVERDKVHHAYLFVGSRGTGKTSMAKILAACLNCENGPTVEPCGVCDSCVSIARATSLDVIEMDAASNNSVDDIRELRDSVAYAPVSGRRKVYILDEAHMLSTAAWNAFLKTLEEPPPNTVFVLATTEANKVPATVVDRCHRFDFHRPTVEQIASVVRRAAQAESIEIPPAAVAALARSATGSFRDALGTLEQIVTYSGASIQLEDVLAVLGVADARLLEETVDAVAAGDAARALRKLEECVEQGRDAGSFASDLEVRARELLVVQVLNEVPAELSLTPEADAALGEQAARVDHATVVRLLELLGEAMEGVRAGADARTRLELALVKAARPQTDGSTRALLARLERLERGGSPQARGNGQDFKEPPAAAAMDGAARNEARVASPAPTATVTSAPAQAPASMPTPASAPAATHAPAATMPPPTASEPPPPTASQPPPPAASQPPPPPDLPPERVAQVPRDIEAIYALWPAVVDLVRSENGLLGACIDEARPVELDGEELTLAYPFSAEFNKKKAESPANRAALGEALQTLAGGRWRLRYELRETPENGAEAAAGGRSEEELVARFMDEFDAEELTDEAAAGVASVAGLDAGEQQDERGVGAATGEQKGA